MQKMNLSSFGCPVFRWSCQVSWRHLELLLFWHFDWVHLYQFSLQWQVVMSLSSLPLVWLDECSLYHLPYFLLLKSEHLLRPRSERRCNCHFGQNAGSVVLKPFDNTKEHSFRLSWDTSCWPFASLAQSWDLSSSLPLGQTAPAIRDQHL